MGSNWIDWTQWTSRKTPSEGGKGEAFGAKGTKLSHVGLGPAMEFEKAAVVRDSIRDLKKAQGGAPSSLMPPKGR